MAEYEVGNSVDIIFPQNNPNLMKIMPKTMVSTSIGGGGGEGTNDHRQLTNRNATNQHPIGAISGLQSALDSKQSSEIEDAEGYFSIDTVEGALNELGASKLNPTTKTASMTQVVGKDSNGMLWTEPTGGGGDVCVFVAKYGETTYQDVLDAVNSGKVCVCQKVFSGVGTRVGYFIEDVSVIGQLAFVDIRNDGRINVWFLNDDDSWEESVSDYYQTSTIVDQGDYFSVNKVEDALQELGALKLNPTNKTSAMTQAVGRDASGKLWTQPLTDHSQLTNRDAENQHPISAISGLTEELETIGDTIADIQTDKQDKLIAGENITIENNVISSIGGEGVDNVFNVTYGVTPIADIVAANSDKKICRMEYNNTVFYLTGISSNSATFSSSSSPRVLKVDLNGTTWSKVEVAMQSQAIKDREEYFSTDTVEGALKELYDALHSLNIDSINGLRNEFGMIADAFEGMAEDINAKISCTDAQVGSYGYIKLSDLPIYDGGVV